MMKKPEYFEIVVKTGFDYPLPDTGYEIWYGYSSNKVLFPKKIATYFNLEKARQVLKNLRATVDEVNRINNEQ